MENVHKSRACLNLFLNFKNFGSLNERVCALRFMLSIQWVFCHAIVVIPAPFVDFYFCQACFLSDCRDSFFRPEGRQIFFFLQQFGYQTLFLLLFLPTLRCIVLLISLKGKHSLILGYFSAFTFLCFHVSVKILFLCIHDLKAALFT